MNDLISRQAALDALNEYFARIGKMKRGGLREKAIGLDMVEVIKNLPPVQPEHGEWKYHSNPTIGINPETAYCSCCGFRVDTTGDVDFDEYNFCPRCGVKMEG